MVDDEYYLFFSSVQIIVADQGLEEVDPNLFAIKKQLFFGGSKKSDSFSKPCAPKKSPQVTKHTRRS